MQPEGSAADVVMLGFDGFAVLAAREVDGEVEVVVETTAKRVGCPECGVIAHAHARRDVVVRDGAVFERRGRLRWRKRVWRCREAVCPKRTWTEQHPAVAPRAALTERARMAACRRVGEGESVAKAARDLGVGWHTIWRAVVDHGTPLVEDPARLAGVERLGMDETAFLKANREHHTLYVSGLVDTATGRLLDVVQDRTARAVAQWLGERDPQWLARVGLVSLDPHRGYVNAVAVHLGHVVVVVDHFHLVKLANAVVDDVRRRVQQATTGHRGRKRDPLYRTRKLLAMGCERLDPQGWQRLAEAVRAGDPDGEVSAAWQLTELVRDLYRAPTLADARETLELLYAWADTGPPECRRLAATIRRWETEILAYHTTGGASNGPTEAVNLLIKKIKRTGHGFRNFHNYRLRLLLHCGVTWHDAPAARLRTRRPRSVA